MNQEQEKDNTSASITEFIAEMNKNKSLLLELDDAQQNIHDEDNSQFIPQESIDVYIEEILRKNNMLVLGSSLDPIFSDDYARIKRPLLSNAFGKSSSLLKKGNFILVTSSIPGEGKTHTAINLALSITQERDCTVLLIDGDVTRHGVSSALGITNRLGLTDILKHDKISISDVILQSDIPGLCLISSGKRYDYVTELLASQRMSELFSEISNRYDNRVIILDGPPLLPTPQTQILSNLVGQVIFVIEAGKTPQIVVEEALDMLSEEQAVGIVMNKCEGISGRSSYYYGY